MRLHHPHPWNLTPPAARALQQQMCHLVETADRLGRVRQVAGVDVGIDRHARRARAAVSVLGFPGLQPLEDRVASVPLSFPYVPGLLSFREIPAVLAALEQLEHLPDLLLCDGQGFAHPRRFGLACHLGVVTGIASIGVAKSRLIGSHDEPPQRRGAWVPLRDGAQTIGAVLRTRTGVRPLFVSIGHRVSLATACDYVMACTTRFRLPETTRRADRLASQRD